MNTTTTQPSLDNYRFAGSYDLYVSRLEPKEIILYLKPEVPPVMTNEETRLLVKRQARSIV
jgi:hypothetical protein